MKFSHAFRNAVSTAERDVLNAAVYLFAWNFMDAIPPWTLFKLLLNISKMRILVQTLRVWDPFFIKWLAIFYDSVCVYVCVCTLFMYISLFLIPRAYNCTSSKFLGNKFHLQTITLCTSFILNAGKTVPSYSYPLLIAGCFCCQHYTKMNLLRYNIYYITIRIHFTWIIAHSN